MSKIVVPVEGDQKCKAEIPNGCQSKAIYALGDVPLCLHHARMAALDVLITMDKRLPDDSPRR